MQVHRPTNINESFRIGIGEVRIFTFQLQPTHMSAAYVPYSKTGFFSKTVCDYLAQEESIRPFYNRFPSLDSLGAQIAEKEQSQACSPEWRKKLADNLLAAYGSVAISEATQHNIELLAATNSFTITTGHQLNLFTGPLYFLYKIVSVINFCKQAKDAYPKHEFIPVYWMATEDHDFDEINYFNFKGSKIAWNRKDGGAVGELNTKGLEEVAEVIRAATGKSTQAAYLQELFEKKGPFEAEIGDKVKTDCYYQFVDLIMRTSATGVYNVNLDNGMRTRSVMLRRPFVPLVIL
ncbi:bacillithiol biosynthesis BshC, partial [Gilvibacter sp.]|uniref:bacillithiol biosynthesis protein BshC n=1 Tax=Gilvibacter sp. TaxID=2729997 RepID=UPI0035BE9571